MVGWATLCHAGHCSAKLLEMNVQFALLKVSSEGALASRRSSANSWGSGLISSSSVFTGTCAPFLTNSFCKQLYEVWISSWSRNVLQIFLQLNEQTGQVIANGVAVGFLDFSFLFTQSPSLPFILLYHLWEQSQSCLYLGFLSLTSPSGLMHLANPRSMLQWSPISDYFYWELLLSERVTTSEVRRTLNKQQKAIKFFILPALCAFLETFLLFYFLILYLEPYSCKKFNVTSKLAVGK